MTVGGLLSDQLPLIHDRQTLRHRPAPRRRRQTPPAGALVDAAAERSPVGALVDTIVCFAAGALLDALVERSAAERTVPDDQAPEAVMQTFRRLNDPERYYGLSWRGWISVALGGGVLYLAVRFSPIGTRATITITVLALALAGTCRQSPDKRSDRGATCWRSTATRGSANSSKRHSDRSGQT